MEISRSELLRYVGTTFFLYLPHLQFYVLSNGKYDRNLVGFVAYSSITLAVLVLFRLSRAWVAPLLFLSLTYSLYILITGKDLGYQVLASIYDTDFGEATELFQARSMQALLVLTLGGFVAAGRFLIRRRPARAAEKTIKINRLWLIGPAVLSLVVIMGLTPYRYQFKKVYPVSFLLKNHRYFFETKLVIEGYRATVRNYEMVGKLDVVPDVPETYLLVIGEATRYQSMSLYGYSRPTTPALDALAAMGRAGGLVVFGDVTAVSPYTRVSVPSLLSPVDAENFRDLSDQPGLIELFKRAGFRTFLVSAQAPAGFHSDLATALMEDVSESIYLKREVRETTHDTDTLPIVDRLLEAGAPKKLIVVHLEGSHVAYDSRYPDDQAYFGEDSIVDRYDNSVRFTDLVLGRLIDRLSRDDRPSALLYVSDHGENLNDCGDFNFGHGARGLTEYELRIPMLFWSNESYREWKPARIEALQRHHAGPVSHDEVAHTLLGLAGIRVDPYRERRDLSSPSFAFSERFVVDRSMHIAPLAEAPMTRCDDKLTTRSDDE